MIVIRLKDMGLKTTNLLSLLKRRSHENFYQMIFFLILGVFVFSDEWMRLRARNEDFILDHAFFRFELHWNDGLFRGAGSDNSPFFNQVFLTTLSILFISILALVGFLYRKDKIKGLKEGLLFLGCGLFFNMKDRLFFGRVTDWIILKSNILENYAFNGADILIGVGGIFLIYLIVFQSNRFWVDREKRGRYYIDSSFQLRVTAFIIFTIFTIFIFFSLSIYCFFKYYLIHLNDLKSFFGPFIFLWILVYLFSMFVTFWGALRFSESLLKPILLFQKMFKESLNQTDSLQVVDEPLLGESKFYRSLNHLWKDWLERLKKINP